MNTIFLWILDGSFLILMLCCAISDRNARTIPNALIGALLGLSLVHLIAICSIGGSAMSCLMAIPLFAICCIGWQHGVLGGGDVKLMTAICMYLGFWKTAIAFVVALALMAVHCLRIRRGHKRKSRRRIALAPPLFMGCVAVIFVGRAWMIF